MPPETLGRYEILGELGKGAMGVVYLARDPLIGRQLALKTFRLGYSAGDAELEQFRTRFLREAQSAGILNHPNIVTIHDVAVDPGGDFFIAMEYVKGTDLKLIMQRQGKFDPRFAVDVVAQIADGLGYAHAKGVVHRDVKPANIILTADKQAKITDFGIARVEASNLTMEGQLLGTPNYMAPEQIQGKEVDHRADLWSLGVMLYEVLTGRKPFAAENLTAVTHKIVFDPFPPLEQEAPSLPPGLSRVLDRALAKDPAERYDRGAEMAADLRAVFAPPAGAPEADGSTATATSPSTAHSGSFLSPAAPATAPPESQAIGVPAPGLDVPPAPVTPVAPPVVSNSAPAPTAEPPRQAPPRQEPPRQAPPRRAPTRPPFRTALAAMVLVVLALVAIGIARLWQPDGEAPPRAAAPIEPSPAPPPAEPPGASAEPAAVVPMAAAELPAALPPPAPAPPPTAPPPAAPPTAVADGTLAIDFYSKVSAGRLTIFAGQQRIYQQPFEFVSPKSGLFRRGRKTSGSLSDRLTLPSGTLDLFVYVKPRDGQTKSVEIEGDLPPGGTRVLRIQVSEEGRVDVQLE